MKPAVFEAPLGNASHSEAAVKAALEIQKEIEDLTERERSASHIGVGVGVNSGEMVAGNLGSKRRWSTLSSETRECRVQADLL